MAKIIIDEGKLEFKEFTGMIPQEEDTLIMETEATEATNGEVNGKIILLHIEDKTAKATFSPENDPTDCRLEVTLPKNWRFTSSFPNLPENYVGDGEFEDSFLGELVFTQAQYILSTKEEAGFKSGLNFTGTVDLKNSYPISWLQHLNGRQNLVDFKGTIDEDANRIQLMHSLGSNVQIHDKLLLKNPIATLFSTIKEDNSLGAEGIALSGTLILKDKVGKEKTLLMKTVTPTHGFSYLGLEAYSSIDPIFLDDLTALFGFETDIIPSEIPQPGLDTFKAYMDLEKKSIDMLELKLSTGEWELGEFKNKKGNTLFRMNDVYLDTEVRRLENDKSFFASKKDYRIELGGEMVLYDGQLFAYGKFENKEFEIGAQLLNSSQILLGTMIGDILGIENKDMPDALGNLYISTLNIKANITKKEYDFALGIGTEWKVGDTKYKLKEIGGAVNHTSETTTFKIWGDMIVGDLEFKSSLDIQKNTWKLEGQIQDNPAIKLESLDSKAKAKIPLCLQKGSDFKLNDLSVTYEKGGAVTFNGEAFIPIKTGQDIKDKDGKVIGEEQINLDLTLNLKKEGDDFSGTFNAAVDYKKIPLELNLAYESSGGASKKSLLFGIREGYKVTLPDLVETLISKDAAEAMPNLLINKLELKIDETTLEVTIDIGKEIKPKKPKKPKTKKTDAEKAKEAADVKAAKDAVGDDTKVKLSKSKDDKSDLNLTYLKFHFKRANKKVEKCEFKIQGAGVYNEDVEFKLLDLDYTYSNELLDPEPDNATDIKVPTKKTEKKEKTNWKIGGEVHTIAYGKGIDFSASFEKTTETDPVDPTVKPAVKPKSKIKKKLKLKVAGGKKDPLIGKKGDVFQLKSLEITIDMKGDDKKKKTPKPTDDNGDAPPK